MARPLAGTQQLRSQERRRQLAIVAARLIEERGFEALSVSEIAEAAGISVGGMYRYIRTKTDLLILACEDIFGGLKEKILDAVAAEEGLSRKLTAAMQTYWRACHDRPSLIRLSYREYRSMPPEAKALYKQRELEIAEVFRDIIRAGHMTGEFRAVDDRIVAHEIIFLSHMGMFKSWAFLEIDRDRLLAEHVELFICRLQCATPARSGQS